MRLTTTIRDAFVRAAINDVPQIDYDEQIAALMQYDLAAQMPPKIKAVYDDPELRQFLNAEFSYIGCGVGYRYLYKAGFEVRPAAQTVAEQLGILMKRQLEERSALEAKLAGVANSVTTRKALVELLPEFEKYLPEEPISSKNLPAISNVVADLVKAGWPKDKTPSAATAA